MSYSVIVGSDETLKGDTFGGLIVVGFRANEEERQKLINLGVQDSKTIVDNKILLLAERLEEYFSDNFNIIELMPIDYNEFMKTQNVTVLLNKLHKKVNEELKVLDSKHVVDKYPGCNVGNIVETKAESKYVEVAAASILARARALKQFKELSIKADFVVPKGSTHVSQALIKLKQRKMDFKSYVKLNFSNVKKIIQ